MIPNGNQVVPNHQSNFQHDFVELGYFEGRKRLPRHRHPTPYKSFKSKKEKKKVRQGLSRGR